MTPKEDESCAGGNHAKPFSLTYNLAWSAWSPTGSCMPTGSLLFIIFSFVLHPPNLISPSAPLYCNSQLHTHGQHIVRPSTAMYAQMHHHVFINDFPPLCMHKCTIMYSKMNCSGFMYIIT